ncbi:MULTISPECIES: LysR substrate-binding domain-containing protein [Streptomyces]|uniref:LysR family transcriptional regulator n=1 Tax=Streptomyces TaxID=1883 RepID=UPI0004CAAC93|nr:MULTISPECIES: LysR substrate-binding domain-containing protein [Streptomyces]RPK84170.1 HTH-type transcriptional regulator CynR [Streptomyces sp. ADI98-10]
MDLRQLEYFLAVVEERSFTRAAARMHVAQPGVSAQIRRLERELGQELLDRSGPAVRPTQAGATLLPHARAALEAVNGGRLALDELAGLVRGRLTVGIVTSFSSVRVSDLLADFHRTYPEVEIRLSEASSDRLVAGLRDSRLDAALISTGARSPAGLRARVIVDEAMVAAVLPHDPLAAGGEVALADLRDRPLICLPPGTGARTGLDEACEAAGFRPRVTMEAGDPHRLVELAARGLGVAVLPAPFAGRHGGPLRGLEIVAPRIRARVALAWPAERTTSPAGQAFIDLACAALPSL